MSECVKNVNSSNFEEIVLKSDKPVLVDFWAVWCGPCRMLAPILEELSEAYAGKAVFVKVDVDDSREAAIEHGITNIPNVIAFKGGKAVANQLGFVPAEQTEEFIKSVL